MPLDQNNEHVVPIGGNNVELPVDDTTAVPAGTRALLVAGIDGAGDARVLAVDTATGALEIAGSFTPTPPADTTVTGTLGALNATVTVACVGKQSVGFQVIAGTLDGTISAEFSVDGGATWAPTYMQQPAASVFTAFVVLTGVGETPEATILLGGGATHARINVISYNAGTSDATVTATNATSDVLPSYIAGGGAVPVSGTILAFQFTNPWTVAGVAAHDAPVSGNPNLVAGKASAAMPANVSADGDATDLWVLRSGAVAAVLTAAGALIDGDAANGLDVDVTRAVYAAATGGAVPASASMIGSPDGAGLLRAPVSFDVDSGVGTQYVLGVSLRASGVGGSVETGTTTSPLGVQGTVAAGVAVTGNPVQIAGIDPVGNAQRLFTDLGGLLWITGAGTLGAAVPARALTIAASDGTNLQTPRVFDVDSGGGTQYVIGSNLRRSGAGGSVELIGQTTMANSLPFALASDQTQFPTALVGGRFDINNGAWLGSTAPTVGQKTMANSIPMVIASDQTAVPVSGTVTANNASIGANGAAIPASSTQAGGSDGTNLQALRVFDADTGVGTQYVLGSVLRRPASGGSVEAGTTTDPLAVAGTAAAGAAVAGNPVQIGGTDGTNARALLLDTSGRQRVIGAAAAGAALTGDPVLLGGSDGTNVQTPRVFDVDSGGGTQYVSGANLRRSASGGSEELLGQTTMAKSIPVAFASDQTILGGTLANGAETTVNSTAGGVQLIAANAARKGLVIQNTGSNNIRVGVSGVTNTTGLRLTAGASVVWSGEGTPTNAIFAIREGASNSTGLAQELT